MNEKCTYKYCFAPDTPCNLGEVELAECIYWKRATKKTSSEELTKANAESGEFRVMPWSGNSLGTVDLEFVASRAQPNLIGVVGAHNAGKTTLLTAFYLLLGKGHRLTDKVFAGSYTLGGWENLADPLRWQAGGFPKFPPHTSSNAGRMPGLLHLAFREQDDTLRDVMFTDAPGEWFERWAVEKHAPDAEGSRWINNHAGAFMLFADSDALSGSSKGDARIQLLNVARRLSEDINNRPVAIVWSKSDVSVPEGFKSSLEKNFRKLFPVYEEFSVSVHLEQDVDGTTREEIMRLLDWLLRRRVVETAQDLVIPTSGEDAFLSFRGY